MSGYELESKGMVHVRQLTYDLKCNWKVLPFTDPRDA